MAIDGLECLHETIFWLTQPDVRRDIDSALDEDARGETITGAELRSEFGLPS
jgi:hypothetical protein